MSEPIISYHYHIVMASAAGAPGSSIRREREKERERERERKRERERELGWFFIPPGFSNSLGHLISDVGHFNRQLNRRPR
jgi:hypothetical protein